MFKTIQYNKERLRDKIYGAWIGKNIGGTIGTPFEGTRKYLDVKGFNSDPGKPLPNDDLDLQLMWLCAMERNGPFNFDEKILGEYWLLGISPIWSEYGRCKANLNEGIVPPLSGSLYNKRWEMSNGAWIRSEIWATLTPGLPSYTRRLAFADACVDHGKSEGTYAEIFTATIESMAFFNNDIRALINEALNNIPKESRVYKAVTLVLEEFDKGTPQKEVREMLVKQSEDIGWFQAPANIGYVTIGLLYGGGDFKKSILCAVNCGDDTDCTGATVGSILGIMHGFKNIPKDWVEYVGDSIQQICITTPFRKEVPHTCTELTDRVMKLLPIVLYSLEINLEWGDEDILIPEKIYSDIREMNLSDLNARSKWSFAINRLPYVAGYAEYDKEPILKAGESIKLRAKLSCDIFTTFNFTVKTILPEGWKIDAPKSLHLAIEDHWCIKTDYKGPSIWEGELTVGENVEPINHVYVIFTPTQHVQPLIIDYIIKG